jgi:signal transduction histidine kinase
MVPSLFPIFDPRSGKLSDGIMVPVSGFCQKAIVERSECKAHYEALATKKEGYYQCPFGFTSRNFFFDQRPWVVTGVVAFPRFNTENERQMAKHYPENKCSRAAIDASIDFVRQVEKYRADAIRDAGKVLPQAFHELRKLNGAVLQHAEREIADHGETRGLASIRSAAELMRNNFDILEALSNIDSMRALPSDSTINLFDLVYKVARVLHEKANARGIYVNVTGARAIIPGSQKSFPIVPAVLLENAIKYGTPNRPIRADISTSPGKAILTVENQSTAFIDTERCFEQGVRFSAEVEGGGFGLFLAREIVAAHNGRIRCVAANGSVRMIVELPLVTVIS